MKRMSVGILLFLLAAALVFSGGSSQKKSDVPEGRVEITYMGWGNNVEQSVNKKIIDTFNKSQNKVWATYVVVPYGDYVTKVNAMASSGSLPDTGMMVEDTVMRWAANGMFLDVSDLFAQGEEAIDAVKFTYNGKTVAYSLANEAIILYYNRALFDKAGLPYPPSRAEDAWAWNQFVDVAKKLTKDNNGRTPNDRGFDKENIASYGIAFNFSTWFWPTMMVSNGGGLVSQDRKTLLINSPESIEAVQALADLYLVHNCGPNPASGLGGDAAMSMLSGQVAMAIDGQWAIGNSYAPAAREGALDYSVAVLPKFKKPVTTNTGGPAVIFNTTKHPQEAKEFLRNLYDPEKNLQFITSGIWQPVRKSWYLEEDKIKTWADHQFRPPLEDYRNAVINYSLNNIDQNPFFYLSCWQEFSELLGPAMSPVWQGRRSAKDVLNALYPELKQIFDNRK
jgi:multiple sugar transport system substrate-binding protein